MKHFAANKILSILSAGFLFTSIHAEETPAILTAEFSADAPVVDGDVLTDPVWQKIPWNNRPFRVFRQKKSPVSGTKIKALHADNALYIAFECKEKEMDKLQKEEYILDFWTFDILELFFAPGGNEMLHLAVSASGTTNEEIPESIIRRTKDKTAWLGKAVKYPDAWTMEICIPLYLLGIQEGEGKMDLPFSVCRYATPSRQYSTWVDVLPGQQLKSVENFGRISLLPAPEQNRKTIRAGSGMPHPLSLYQRWMTIRKDDAWSELLISQKEIVFELDKLSANGIPSGSEAIRFAELISVLENQYEKNEIDKQNKILKKLFEEK